MDGWVSFRYIIKPLCDLTTKKVLARIQVKLIAELSVEVYFKHYICVSNIMYLKNVKMFSMRTKMKSQSF